ncbi:MAG: hypothetical protein M3312_01670 [Actinomycetota bacterium]|nr:hypothetical protein [Actinomycetota bacterium]
MIRGTLGRQSRDGRRERRVCRRGLNRPWCEEGTHAGPSPDPGAALELWSADPHCSTERSAALTGVLISVTTTPAAATVGSPRHTPTGGRWEALSPRRGIKLTCLTLSGIPPLGLLRALHARRRASHLRHRS